MTGIKCETFDDCKAAAKVCQLPAVRLSTPHDTWRLLSLSLSLGSNSMTPCRLQQAAVDSLCCPLPSF